MQHQRLHHRFLLTAAVALITAVTAVLLGVTAGGTRRVSYSGEIQPIFDAKCTSCHPVSYPYLDLRRGHSYAQLVRVRSPLAPAFERVLPGRPELSYLLTHVPDPSRRHLLTPADRRVIERWIRGGAQQR